MNLLAVQCKGDSVFPQDSDKLISCGDQDSRLKGPDQARFADFGTRAPTGIAARIASVRDWS